LILIATSVLWLRSIHHADLLAMRSPGGHLQGVGGDHWGVLFVLTELPYEGSFGPNDTPGATSGSRFSAVSVSSTDFASIHELLFDPQVVPWKLLGFHGAAGQLSLSPQLTPKYSALLVPYWFLALVSGVPVWVTARQSLRRRRRERLGLCRACGYDIRASSGQCPECGARIESKIETVHKSSENASV